jgi:hypothetical protein
LGDPNEIVDNLVTNSNTDELKVHITGWLKCLFGHAGLSRRLVVELAAPAGPGASLAVGPLDLGGGELSEGTTSSASTSATLRRSPSGVSLTSRRRSSVTMSGRLRN